MTTAKNEAFAGLSHENCYLVWECLYGDGGVGVGGCADG